MTRPDTELLTWVLGPFMAAEWLLLHLCVCKSGMEIFKQTLTKVLVCIQ